MATEQQAVDTLGQGQESRPGSQEEIPVSANEGADIFLPAEVSLTTGPFQRQVVHGQHHHLTGNTINASSSKRLKPSLPWRRSPLPVAMSASSSQSSPSRCQNSCSR